jgi:hypothetical protein
VLKALEIEPYYIDKGNPWQNLIEAQFKVQLRSHIRNDRRQSERWLRR